MREEKVIQVGGIRPVDLLSLQGSKNLWTVLTLSLVNGLRWRFSIVKMDIEHRSLFSKNHGHRCLPFWLRTVLSICIK